MVKKITSFGLASLVVVTLALTSCGLIHQARELQRFAKCNFVVNSVALERVAGVDMTHVKQISDLGFTEVIAFSSGIMSGKLPADILLNVNVSNPSVDKAAVSGMDWKLVQKNEVIATGKLDTPVEVAGHGRTSFNIKAQVNLVAVFQLNSIDQIAKIMSGNLDSATLQKMGISIQLKPYYILNGKVKKYPGYLTITPDFSN